MSDRLLDETLAELAAADSRTPPGSDLEQRTMAQWDEWRGSGSARTGQTAGSWRRPSFASVAASSLGAAALVALAASLPGVWWPVSAPNTRPAIESAPIATPIDAPSGPLPLVHTGARPRIVTERRGGRRWRAPVDVAPFIPIAPGLEQELTGPFQVARVTVPRRVLVNLGILHEGQREGDPVQADVMFGEDGMAKAIRMSTAVRRVR